MFKKRSKKKSKRTKKASSILAEGEELVKMDTSTAATTTFSSNSGNDSIGENAPSTTLQSSVLAATRAEQQERGKNRNKRRATSVVVVSGDGSINHRKRRKDNTNQPPIIPAAENDTDTYLEEFIAERMQEHKGTTTTTKKNVPSEDQELDPYGLLRRKATHLTAEQGGVSDIAGSGIGGIGIYEVELPEDDKKMKAKLTEEAIKKASEINHSETSALAGLNLPMSFSGNFIKSQGLLYRGDAVSGPDGSIIVSKNQTYENSSKRATDFKAFKNFKNNMR
jgi:hypothetical protein